MSKKIIALILAVCFCLTTVVTAYAVTPSITVSSEEAERGQEVTVKVSLANNPGIVTMNLLVKYDTNVLEYKSASIDSKFSSIPGAVAIPNEAANKTIYLNWTILSIDGKDCTLNGTFAEIKFVVKADAAKGDSAIIVTYDEENIYNAKEENVNFAVNNGKVTVKVPCKHENTELKNAKEANCITEGYTGDTYCKDCGALVKAGEKIQKNAQKHTGNTEVRNEKAATCAAEGYTGDTYCKDCGELVKNGTAIPKNAQNHVGGTEIKDAKKANCVDEGYTGDTYCKGCGIKLSDGQKIAVNPENHKEIEVINKKDATCKDAGYTGDTRCKACDTVIAKGTEIAKTENHKFGEWKVVKEATKSEEGLKERVCSICNKVETAKIAKLNDKDSESIHISANGESKGEKNPNTGAEPIIGMAVLTAVCTGAYIVSKKRH